MVEHLLPIGSTLPVEQAQARPLTSLPPEQQREVWQEAVETAPARKVTAKHVQATVQRVKDRTTSPTPRVKPQERPAADWQEDFQGHFNALSRTIERFKHAGGVLVMVEH